MHLTNILEEELKEAVQNIHGTITELELSDTELEEDVVSIPADPDVKNFSFTVVNEEVYYRENSVMNRMELPAMTAERVKGMVKIRDVTNELIQCQMEEGSDEQITKLQEKLNEEYDIFTAKYGLISSNANKRAFSQDSSYCLLTSLEFLDDKGELKRKADIFTKRTIRRAETVTSVDTASEALAVSIGERAGVDLSYMAQLSGKTEEELTEELAGVIFKNPISEKWEPSDEYLSGNVREKLQIAKQFAENHPEYQVNVQYLEQVQPKDLDASEIEARLGATWISEDYITRFMAETFHTPRYYVGSKVKVQYAEVTGQWNVMGKNVDSYGNALVTSTYGTQRANAYRLLEDALNLRDTKIYDTVQDAEGEHRELNRKETMLAQQKQELIAEADQQIAKVGKLFNRGLISDNERYNQTIAIWQATTDKVAKALAANLPEDNEIYMMADSGARGSMNQIKQLAGMRGLLANTAGKTIEMPIRANYREGLNILEYFVSARGARKGLADTALRTADSGYLTRRMVDVSQEVIVREIDCGTTDGLWVSEIHEGKEKIESFRERIIGRYAVGDVINPVTGEVIVPEGKMIDLYDANDIEAAGITKLKIRSLLTCRAKIGVCAHCYGSDMANGEPVQLGESIGVIAAESIGEPGTQLTMRTFHTGGIASAEDITQGLPRVEELFESRRPKSMAIMSEISGVVSQDDTKKNVVIKVTGKDENGAEVVKSYSIPFTQHSRVMPGDRVEKGDIITREGVLYPQDILAIKGLEDVQNYLINEVQKVYRLQGVEINDKHIEVIVRQMCRKVRVTDSGSSDLIGGALANRLEVENINAELQKRIDDGEEGIKLVEYQQVLLGITKAALANDSFLSAASFQETTRVLTEAAIKGKVDPLAGLKENVIIGKLIPAGTGLPEVREDLKRREEERDAEVAAELAAAARQ